MAKEKEPKEGVQTEKTESKPKKEKPTLQTVIAEDGMLNTQGWSWENIMPIMIDPVLEGTEYAQKHIGIASPFAYRLRRLNRFDERWYSYTDDATDDIRYCMSVTTFTKKSLGMDKYLLNYLMEMGKEASDIHVKWASEYGTFFHIEAGNLFKYGFYDFGPNGLIAENKLVEYMYEKIGKGDTAKLKGFWCRKFYKDMAALFQFVKDRNVRPVGVEFPILSYRWPIASVIDLVCELDWKGKRVYAIVDFKTGNDFYDEHALQLSLYREMWNEHFETVMPIEHIFNWRPKDFKVSSGPSYELLNQSDNEFDFEGRLAVGYNEGWFDKGPAPQYIISGKVSLGDDMTSRGSIVNFSELYKQIVKNEAEKSEQ